MTQFFKKAGKGTQAAGYATATVLAGAVTIPVMVAHLVARGSNLVFRLDSVEHETARAASYGIACTEFFALKANHKKERVKGKDYHLDKSDEAFDFYRQTFK